MKTVTLWRPIGLAELDLIVQADFDSFPPRLPGQPFFYPVCNLEYARMIADKWNAPAGMASIVVRFEILEDFIKQYAKHIVGPRVCEEYWIPAGELDNFNKAIVGKIQVVT